MLGLSGPLGVGEYFFSQDCQNAVAVSSNVILGANKGSRRMESMRVLCYRLGPPKVLIQCSC